MRTERAMHLLTILLALVPESALAAPGGPVRQDYVVAGAEAWEAAHRAGFEFSPVLPEGPFILAGDRDGKQAELKSCPTAESACETEARVRRGVLFVLPPRCVASCSRDHAFELFAGRALAPGWSLVAVELAGTGWWWERAPVYGTRDASFVVRARAASGREGRVRLARIVLRGPAGADWRQAFAASGGDPDGAP